MSTTIRPECGTIRGVLAHDAAVEDWCGWCLHAERTARLAAERLTLPVVEGFSPVTPEQAEANRDLLDREVALFDAKHVQDSRRRFLRSVA